MYLMSVMPEGYRELVVSDEVSLEEYDLFCWNGESRKDNWKPPRLEWISDEFTNDSDPEPDIASVSGVLAVNEKAKDVLNAVFSDQVEFLPVIGPDEKTAWYIVNIVNKLDLMDVSKSKFKIKRNGKVGVCEHAFIDPPPADARIFEVKGFEPHIFASEEVKDALIINGLVGGLLREYQNP